MKLLRAITVFAFAAQAAALSIGGKNMKIERDSDGLQDIVSTVLSAIFSHTAMELVTNWTGLGYI